MLLELKVSNFAIIENLHISFKQGLNVLSGETGAGKSVLLKSLSMLMGFKGSSEQIRSGSRQASIEGSFDLSGRPDILGRVKDMGLEVDDNILVVRRVLAEEKSRVYINGSLSSLNILREIVSPLIEMTGAAAPLIEMTGQFENRNLLSKSYHLDLLDYYAGNWELRGLVTEKFSAWKSLLQEISLLENDNRDRSQRLDYLTFQKNEISELDLSPMEDLEIEQKLKKMRNSSKISQFTDSAEAALYSDDDSSFARLQKVLQKAGEIRALTTDIDPQIQALEQAKAIIQEAVYDLRTFGGNIEHDPATLDSLEDRLNSIRRLQKKFGPTVDDILQALLTMETEISKLQNSEQNLAKMRADAQELETWLWKKSEELHKRRQSASELLQASVNDELADLNMKGVIFHVEARKTQELNAAGCSEVEFLSQTSSKDQKNSLAKFASGGELSRILLSLKRVIGSAQLPRTYLFDEVDSGVSGPTAEKVGKKLRSISKGQQVICVTHLPQVAAFGDWHFYIQKSPLAGGVQMEVLELPKKDRVKEIARLISGEKITKTSLAHAEQLIAEAQ